MAATPTEPSVYSPDATLEHLQALTDRSWGAELLLQAHLENKAIVTALKAGLQTEEQGLLTLARYLKGIYATVSALPAGIKFHQLDLSIVMSGLLAPFVAGMDLETKRMEIGLPMNADAVSDTLAEVLIVSAAAWATYWHYLNYRHAADAVPSDDAALMLTTLCIKSLSQPSVSESVDKELSALGVEGLGAKELKWLMHYTRSELTGWFAAVQYLLNDERAEESLVAQQQDRLSLIKTVGNNPLGYLLYARSCLQFQQHRPAHIFATKGITVCEAMHDDIVRPQLMCVQAIASVLGGAGSTYSPMSTALQLLDARRALGHVTTWLPAPYHPLLRLGPEAGALAETVLGVTQPDDESEDATPAFTITEEEEQAAAALPGDEVPVREAVYATPAPKALPIGCLSQLAAQAAPAAPQ